MIKKIIILGVIMLLLSTTTITVFGATVKKETGNQFTTSDGNNKPVIEYFTGPKAIDANVEGEFKVYVSDLDGDNIWLKINWESIAPWDVEWIGPYNSNEEITLYHTWDYSFDNWILQIGVKAKDIYDDESEEIHHRLIIGNDPPGIDYFDGPSSGVMGTEYTFEVWAYDYETDEIYLYVDWGDGTNTDWLGPYDPVNDPDPIFVNHTWTAESATIIKAKVKDEHGAESVWVYHNFVVSKNKVINNFRFLLDRLFQRNLNKFIFSFII